MNPYTFCVPCLFGLEGLVGDELRRMDAAAVRVGNGRVYFEGGADLLARANLRLRMGERVRLTLGEVPAATRDELCAGVSALPWEDFIPRDGQFPVKGHSLDSKLHAVPTCQAMIQKAVAKRLGAKYHLQRLPATGAVYQIQFSLRRDRAELFLDTSGAGLHKRGYRAVGNDAPLRETLAAAMVQLARYRGRDVFLDPFCGSGTIVIEAALTALNRAPGLRRSFSAERWPWIPQALWQQERAAAMDGEFRGDYRIFGSDVDPACVKLAAANARKAGVEQWIRFSEADATRMPMPAERGVLVCNPPYGERMLEQRSAQRLYQQLGRHLAAQTGWKQYIISSEPEFERYYGRKADKKRKLYNGMIQCNLYMYF